MPEDRQGQFWNPRTETMPRTELERLQLLKLQRVVRWAYEGSPFHRRKFAAGNFILNS